MYDKATVLDYKDKKIWIKHISKSLYCVNGVLISFLPQFDLSNVSILAQSVEEWYHHLHNTTEKAIIKYELEDIIINGNTVSTTRVMHLDECKYCDIDISNIDKVFAEYEEWAKDRDDVYAQDCRDIDVNQWLYEAWGWQ